MLDNVPSTIFGCELLVHKLASMPTLGYENEDTFWPNLLADERKMPRYELCLITRILNKDGFAGVLRRTASWIMDNGGVVRKLENLGEQELPNRMRSHAENFTHGRYFVIDFYLSASKVKDLQKELKVDTDLIRPGITKKENVYGEEGHKFNYLTCNRSYKKPVYKNP